ncbi:MAG: sugar ABC transporter substrate-binding protein [Saccharofermentanales bacterium]|jgi:arabinogalactan oligomer/maltooligosaccharide transport system substrate-binding protein
MRKIATTLLALLLVASLVIGCAPSDPPVESQTPKESEKAPEVKPTDKPDDPEEPVKPAALSITVQVEADWMDHYEAAAKRVKDANPDVEIELKEVACFTHLETLEQTDATNEDVADVFAIPADRLVSLANKDLIGAVDAQAMAAKLGGWDDFDGGLGGLFKLNDEYRAFPFNIETLVAFANVKNAEALGLEVPEDLSQVEPLELNYLPDPAYCLIPVFDTWFGVALMNSADIALLKQDGDTFVSDMTTPWDELDADKKAAIEILYKYWKLNADNNTTLFDAEAGWGYIDSHFESGSDGIIRIGGPWDIGNMKALTSDGEDLVILPIGIITAAGKPLKHWQGGWGLTINPRIEEDPAKVALAEAMICEIVNPEYAVDLFKAAGKILENVPYDVYAASDLDEVEKSLIKAVLESYADSPGRPLFEQYGNVWDTYKNAILSWNAVKPADAAAAYAEIKASFDNMMANLK